MLHVCNSSINLLALLNPGIFHGNDLVSFTQNIGIEPSRKSVEAADDWNAESVDL
jgi:hypothetical protein